MGYCRQPEMYKVHLPPAEGNTEGNPGAGGPYWILNDPCISLMLCITSV